jgi:hypothetical protein
MKAQVFGVNGFDLEAENDADKALLYSWRLQRPELCGTHYRDGKLVGISIWFKEKREAQVVATQ